jgi:hypothetical protein
MVSVGKRCGLDLDDLDGAVSSGRVLKYHGPRTAGENGVFKGVEHVS